MVDFQFDANTHIYTIDSVQIPSVTQVIKDIGIIHEVEQKYLDFGTALHKTCELYDKCTLDRQSLDPILEFYLKTWIKFLNETNCRILEIENVRYSKKYKYGFTIDRIVEFNNKITILDIKSSNISNHLANKLQLAAYQNGYNEYNKLKSVRRIAVHLRSNGTYKIEEYKNKRDFNGFLSCLNVFNLKKRG